MQQAYYFDTAFLKYEVIFKPCFRCLIKQYRKSVFVLHSFEFAFFTSVTTTLRSLLIQFFQLMQKRHLGKQQLLITAVSTTIGKTSSGLN